MKTVESMKKWGEKHFLCIGGKEEKEKLKKEQEKQEREKMQFLVSNFTEDQLDRYAMYRRASFPKATIRRLMQTITGNSSMGKFCPILNFMFNKNLRLYISFY